MAGSLFERAKTLFRNAEPEPTAAAPRKAVSPHHAVVVVPGRHACAEAYALRDRRFLSREAPVLPLAGCGSLQCECRYEHHDDRRKGLRRARDLAVVDRRARRRRAARPLEARASQGRHEIADVADAARQRPSPTNGLLRRSSPKVDIGPWPGTKRTSSPSGNSFSRIARMSVA